MVIGSIGATARSSSTCAADPSRTLGLFLDPLQIGQIVIAIAVTTSILLQARGTGLSSTFGGESTAYRSRRGLERTLFRLTIVLILVFVVISLFGARNTSTG